MLVIVIWYRVASGVELISDVEFDNGWCLKFCFQFLKNTVVNCLVDAMV